MKKYNLIGTTATIGGQGHKKKLLRVLIKTLRSLLFATLSLET